jgi:alkylated DNA repair dioxygenase AlkB
MKPTQNSLFNGAAVLPQLPDAELEYYENFLAADVAWDTYHQLLEVTDWRQESITVFGKTHPTPRLSSWVGDPEASYRYSNMTMQPQPWSSALLDLKAQVEQVSQHCFNSVLLNWYRDGQDSNGWHSDNEPELGKRPVIASLSLGAIRDFQLKHRNDKRLKYALSLAHGSLLVMRGNTQQYWQHQIPKRATAGSRINLTFRTIITTKI